LPDFRGNALEIPGIALDIWKCPELFSQISARTYSCFFNVMIVYFERENADNVGTLHI
jgi:hypothetical protein